MIAQALLSSNAPTIAKAVMKVDDVREAVFKLVLDTINTECTTLCNKMPDTFSYFRKIPVAEIVKFRWEELINELKSKAPTLLQVLSTIAARNDHRNKKVGAARYPGICTAAAIISKGEELGGVWATIHPFSFYVLLPL